MGCDMKACKPKSMKSQLIRGAIGLALLVVAGFLYRDHYALSFLFVLLSFIPLKGCPVCWTVETCEVARNTKKPSEIKPADDPPLRQP